MHRLTREQARRIAVRAQLLGDDLLVGKVDAIADRNASVLRVNAVHEDVKFTRAMRKAVEAELDDLSAWLELGGVEPS